MSPRPDASSCALFLLLGALASGCGPRLEASTDGGVPDGGAVDSGTTNTGSCGVVGLDCGAGCPSGYGCAGHEQQYCLRNHEDCGGFAGKLCPAPDLCIYPDGSSAGVCVTAADHACICARQPGAVHGC